MFEKRIAQIEQQLDQLARPRVGFLVYLNQILSIFPIITFSSPTGCDQYLNESVTVTLSSASLFLYLYE